jgi:hypothetical protein
MKALAAVTALLSILLAAPSVVLAATGKDHGYRKASYKVAIRGIQVTTWKYHKDKGADPCDYFADGEGGEEIRFNTLEFQPLVAINAGSDRPSLFRQYRLKPLIVRLASYDADATVDRWAKTSSGGAEPSCPNEFSGGDGPEPPPDCGEHKGIELSLFLSFRYRDHLKLEEDPTRPGLAGRELYKRCEHHGERALLLEGLGVELSNAKLFGLKWKQRYDFTWKDEKTVSISHGGTARTAIRYRLTLKRVSKVSRTP